MRMKLNPAVLSGRIRAVTSKSMAHRSLICAALSDGPTELVISDRSADIEATVDCLRAMGAQIQIDGELCRVTPIDRNTKIEAGLNCRESGSTLRFLLPVAAAVCERAVLLGEGRLPQRPMDPLLRVLKEKGTRFAVPENGETLPLTVEGSPRGGTYRIEGNISSQYISGLLFALPLLEEDSEIELISPMESSAYVDMTLEALERSGIRIEKRYRDGGDGSNCSIGTDSPNRPAGGENLARELTGFTVRGGQTYRCPGCMDVEGDWSNAAFFLAAGALAGDGIECVGLNAKSAQGDRTAAELLRSMGARVTLGEAAGETAVSVSPAGLTGMEIDVSQIPDLMPILAVTACGARGITVFCNAGRLRLKESDRIASTAALIRSLGGEAEEGEDSLTVHGTGRLRGGIADSFGDHRIAMSAAVAALICTEPVILNGAEAVAKSYPEFFRDYNALGGNAHVI